MKLFPRKQQKPDTALLLQQVSAQLDDLSRRVDAIEETLAELKEILHAMRFDLARLCSANVVEGSLVARPLLIENTSKGEFQNE